MKEELKTLLIEKICSFSGMNIYDTVALTEIFSKHIFNRLSSIINRASDFFFENDYVETEWKDMISLHYVNTVYKCDNRVARIHFFSENCCEHSKREDNKENDFKSHLLPEKLLDIAKNENYLGFITLRPIPEPLFMLSFIYPNFDVYDYFKDSYILKYKKTIHLNGREFIIHTFPHFSQDGITAVCANAALIMMSKYLHNKYNYKDLRLGDINGNSKWLYPNDGFSPKEIFDVAVNNKIPLRLIEKRNDTKDLIRTYISSGLPVLIFSTKHEHIVLIVGVNEIKNDYNFIVYDDSAAFFSCSDEGNDKEKSSIIKDTNMREHFANIVSWEKIDSWLGKDDHGIIIPLFERVILSYDDVKEMFRENLYFLFTGNRQIPIKELDDFCNSTAENIRLFNASKIKQFLTNIMQKIVDLKSKEISENFIEYYTEHYVWIDYGAFPRNEDKGETKFFLSLANPTIAKNSRSIFPDTLYINKEILDLIKELDKF